MPDLPTSVVAAIIERGECALVTRRRPDRVGNLACLDPVSDRIADASQLRQEALAVWLRARRTEGLEPSPERIARVRTKLADPDALLVVAMSDSAVIGMALAEPFVGSGCDGPAGHVSMVFVDPRYRRRGTGRALFDVLLACGWSRLSLWTRDANDAGRGLYAAVGFAPTADHGHTPAGEPMTRWQRGPDEIARVGTPVVA